ncbi:hypothetical protein GCM10010244_85940 [Streptomyces coeruleorubidus]|nr:hypothetical protein GCM10010244_85940 [Streptomyces bellus]
MVADEQGGHPEQGHGGQPAQGPTRRDVIGEGPTGVKTAWPHDLAIALAGTGLADEVPYGLPPNGSPLPPGLSLTSAW